MTRANFRDRPRRIPWIAWGVVLLVAAGLITALALFAVNRATDIPPSWAAEGGPRLNALYWVNILALAFQSLVGAVLGALVIARHPRNRVGWLMLWTGFIGGLVTLVEEATIYAAFTASLRSPLVGLSAWAQNWLWVVLYSSLLLLLALFPTGRFLSRRWTWIVGLPLLLFAVGLLTAAAIERQLTSAYGIANPIFTAPNETLFNALFTFGVPMMPLSVLAALAQLAARYRAAGFVERQQIKWLLVGMIAMLVTLTAGLALALGAGSLIGAMMANGAGVFPVLGIGIGMLRYRLLDVDLIIRRTVVYGLLTGALALVYFSSVIAMQTIAQRLTGEAGSSPLIIVASTLLIAALFTPLRRRLQEAIDRRFYRSKYDAAQTLARFAQSARDEVELGQLSGELLRVVEETMQPTHIYLWLRKR